MSKVPVPEGQCPGLPESPEVEDEGEENKGGRKSARRMIARKRRRRVAQMVEQ